jgi:hypothetical protein
MSSLFNTDANSWLTAESLRFLFMVPLLVGLGAYTVSPRLRLRHPGTPWLAIGGMCLGGASTVPESVPEAVVVVLAAASLLLMWRGATLER